MHDFGDPGPDRVCAARRAAALNAFEVAREAREAREGGSGSYFCVLMQGLVDLASQRRDVPFLGGDA
jgi:hypothetical protein